MAVSRTEREQCHGKNNHFLWHLFHPKTLGCFGKNLVAPYRLEAQQCHNKKQLIFVGLSQLEALRCFIKNNPFL